MAGDGIHALEEFSPVKNGKGVDSPLTAKRAISNLAGKWHELAGVTVPRNRDGNVAVPLEISPRFALDVEEFKARIAAGQKIEGPKYWE